ncbi:MAG: hypothetical protein AMJ91_03035 [candidate division Zixibacteria bacterium SM23_73_3]|nr:MAG: hypothetical protein AMJ91_03035 [candidate division Zixibacteria bacterium SM23_73_3]
METWEFPLQWIMCKGGPQCPPELQGDGRASPLRQRKAMRDLVFRFEDLKILATIKIKNVGVDLKLHPS